MLIKSDNFGKIFFKTKSIIINNLILVSFLVISTVGGLISPNFFTIENIFNILKQSTPLIICSMAMLFVIMTGGIDLSIGSFVALISVILSILVLKYSILISLFIGLLSSIILGSINGIMVTYGKMAPFIATLVTMSAGRGLALIFSEGGSIYLNDNIYFDYFANGYFLGIPILVYLSIMFIIIFIIIRNKTYLGRFWIAIGSNRSAAYYAGINIRKYELLAYIISGISGFLAAFVYLVRTGTGSPILAQGFELDVIAAVVIGGASLSGGKGLVLNTVIGALILSLISNLMNLLGIPGYHQQVIKGILIAVAVLSENLRKK